MAGDEMQVAVPNPLVLPVISPQRTRKDEATVNLLVPWVKGEKIMPNFQ